MQNKISRRQFLQVTGASAAVLLLAGLPVEASAACRRFRGLYAADKIRS